jgi:hypothetical protein
MDDIVYQIDNWTIVKLLGGLSAILIAGFGLIFFLLQNRLLDRWRHSDQKEIETLRGLIERNNSVFNTVFSKSLPDKIVEKRLAALETIWNFVIETKNKPPAAVRLIYSILADKEINLENVRKLSKGQLEVIRIDGIMMSKPLITDYENLRYLVPPNLWTIVFVYQAMINRTTYLTIDGLQRGKFLFWKTDEGMKAMLRNVLDEKEVHYIYNLEFQTFDILLNLLEHKILTEVNKIISGENDTEDSLKVARRIGDLTREQ